LIILGVFLGLLLVSELLINPIINSIVKPKMVANVNDRNYHLKIDNLSYNLFTNSLSAENIFYTWNDSSVFTIDSSVIFIPESSAKGISLFNLIFRSRLTVREVQLHKPEYKIFSLNKESNKKNSPDENNNDSLSFIYKSIYKLIPNRIKPFKINTVEIINGVFKKTDEDKNILVSVGSLNTAIKDFSIKSLEQSDSLTLMFCEEIGFNIDDVELVYPKYEGSVKSLNFSSADSILTLKTFSFQPLLPDTDFFDGDIYRDDRWKIKVAELKCEGIDLSKYIWHKTIDVENMTLNSYYIDILTNMRLNIPPDFDPEMPNEIISGIPFDLNIGNINLNIDSIVVREFWLHSKLSSRLPFTKVKGRLLNISSLKEYQSTQSPMVIEASAFVADKGLLKVNMKIPLRADGTDFNYSGSLGPMPANHLNDHLIISDLVEITSGKIDSLFFKAEAKNGKVSAYVLPYYKELTVRSINKSTMKSDGLLASIETFVGNTFKIKNANSKEFGRIRVGSILYLQKKTDVFLDVVWGPLKLALGQVVGF